MQRVIDAELERHAVAVILVRERGSCVVARQEFAVAGPRRQLVQLALDGAQPGGSAAARGDAALVKVLVGGGATIDEQNAAGNTALIVAIREGHTDVCRVLLKGGANARVRNKDRIDALDTAKRRNMAEIVALLDTH